MKAAWTLIFLSVLSSPADAQARLCRAAGLPYCPRVVEVDPFPNGANIVPFFGTIHISRGLVRNEHERAFVIAHELGHLVMRLRKHTEEEADDYALKLIRSLGYDCKAIEVLRRLKLQERWRRMKEQC